MASSMAASLARRGFRLASSSVLLLRRSQSPVTSLSFSRAIFGSRTPEVPSSLRVNLSASFATSAASKSSDTGLKKVLESEIQCAQEDAEGDQVYTSPLLFLVVLLFWFRIVVCYICLCNINFFHLEVILS